MNKLLTSKLHQKREITAIKTCTTVETITKTVKTEVVEDNTSINSPRSHSRYVTQYSSENEGRCCADVSQLAAIKRYITFFSIIFLNARVRLLCDSVARNPAASLLASKTYSVIFLLPIYKIKRLTISHIAPATEIWLTKAHTVRIKTLTLTDYCNIKKNKKNL